MQENNITIDEILSKILKNFQINNINLQTWEKYFQFYYQASNTMALDLQNLIKLNEILSNASVVDFKTDEEEIRFKLERKLLKADIFRLNSLLSYFCNAFDNNGFLKPEWAMTESEKNKMLYNNDDTIIENDFFKR